MFGEGALVSQVGDRARPDATPGPARATRSTASAQTDVEGLTGPRRRDPLPLQRHRRRRRRSPTASPATPIWESLPFVAAGQRAPAARRHLDVRRAASPASSTSTRSSGPTRRDHADAPRRGRPAAPAGSGRRRRAPPGRRLRRRARAAARGRARCTSPRAPPTVGAARPVAACSPGARRPRPPRARRVPAAPAARRRSPSASRSASPAPRCSRSPATRSPRPTPSRSTPAPTWPSSLAAAFGVALPVAARRRRSPSSAGWPPPALVLALAAGGRAGPTRLILAGSATALALGSLTTLLLLLFEQETIGLFAWGNGSLVQSDLDSGDPAGARGRGSPSACSCCSARRLDMLALGDDTAAVLGARRPPHPARRRAARRAARRRGGHPRRADRLRRAVRPGDRAAARAARARAAPAPAAAAAGRPGRRRRRARRRRAAARRARRRRPGSSPDRRRHHAGRRGGPGLAGPPPPRLRPDAPATRGASARCRSARVRRRRASPSCAAVAGRRRGRWACCSATPGCSPATCVNWCAAAPGRRVTFVLDQRAPARGSPPCSPAPRSPSPARPCRRSCRNPLAEPGILGITGGAGLGAVAADHPRARWPGSGRCPAAAGVGALLAFALVYGLAWRGGLTPTGWSSIGIGVSAGGDGAHHRSCIVADRPVEHRQGADLAVRLHLRAHRRRRCVPVAVALLLVVPLVVARAPGAGPARARRRHPPRARRPAGAHPAARCSALAALLTADRRLARSGSSGSSAWSPRTPPGRSSAAGHARVLPVAALLGALLVSLADTLGRTVIAPGPDPGRAGHRLIGTPYFVWLLWRSRVRAHARTGEEARST